MARPIRIGFLVPPGNPTCEPEVIRLTPPGVTVHFTRMVAHGNAGSHDGQEERNRTQIAHLDENVALLNMVKPAVIVMAHTASSYTLGQQGEADLVARMEKATGARFLTAFGSVLAALKHLGAQRLALGAPYAREAMLRSKAHLELHGLQVPGFGNLENVANIYDETPERAYGLDHPGAGVRAAAQSQLKCLSRGATCSRKASRSPSRASHSSTRGRFAGPRLHSMKR
ncbi:MAG: hypothetical protein EBS65_10470 [Betaproteobacteria bacterium]|nr:hypothetical protein [Betaproteobacteria bacterium]